MTEPRAIGVRSADFAAIIAMSLLIMIGFGLVVPALPAFAEQFGVAESGVALVIMGFSLTRLFGDIFAGSSIDRFGERLVTALGAAIVGLSSIAAGAARSFAELVVFRGLGGIGSALFLGGLYAYLLSVTEPRERGRAMSIFQGSFAIGLLLGPLLGGLLMKYFQVNTPLYVYGVVCLVAAVACIKVMNRPHDRARAARDAAAPGRREAARGLFKHSAYHAALAASAIGFLTVSASQTLIPLHWVKLAGGEREGAGLPFAMSALAALVVLWHAGALADKRGRRFAMIPSLAALVVTTAALGFTSSTVGIVLLMTAQGFAGGYARPGAASIIGDIAPPEIRGLAVSGHRIASDVGAVIGPLIAGLVAEHVGYRAAYLSIAACCLAALLLAIRSEETAPIARRAA